MAPCCASGRGVSALRALKQSASHYLVSYKLRTLRTSSQLSTSASVMDFGWMKGLDMPATKDYIVSTNTHAANFFSSCQLAQVRQRLINETDARSRLAVEAGESFISTGTGDIPEQIGKFEYYAGRPRGQQHPVYYRRHNDGCMRGDEEVLVDLNEFAGAPGYCSLGALKVSRDSAFLAFTVDTDGSETYTLHVKDMRAKNTLAAIQGVVNMAWAPYASGEIPRLYYTTADAQKRACRVHVHALDVDGRHHRDGLSNQYSSASPPTSSSGIGPVVFEEAHPGRYVDVSASKDGKLVVAQVVEKDCSEVHVLEYESGGHTNIAPSLASRASARSSSAPRVAPLCIHPRSPHVQYFVEHFSGYPIIVTNAGGADDYQIVAAPVPGLRLRGAEGRSRENAIGAAASATPALDAKMAGEHSTATATLDTHEALPSSWIPLYRPAAGVRIEDVDVFGTASGNHLMGDDGGSSHAAAGLSPPSSASTTLPALSSARLIVPTVDGGDPATGVDHKSSMCDGVSADAATASGRLVVYERYEGKPRVRVISLHALQTTAKQSRIGRDSTVSADATSGAAGQATLAFPYRLRHSLVPLPTGASSVIPGSNADPHADTLRLSITSTTSPEIDCDYHFKSQELKVLRRRTVGSMPGRPIFYASDYASYVLHAPSHDNEMVPITVVHSKHAADEKAVRNKADSIRSYAALEAAMDVPGGRYRVDWRLRVADAATNLPRRRPRSIATMLRSAIQRPATMLSWPSFLNRSNGSNSSSNGAGNPCLLHLYGAYGIDVDTAFRAHRVPLLERGWVMAFAHIRGGKEKGAHWYKSGRGMQKLNSMHDAAAAAKMLIACGLTTASRVACKTESAGGVVGGWLANNHPGLIRAHILHVPFLDVLGAMTDVSLPLTVAEFPEWGDPNNSADVKDYIRSYSPYDNIPMRTSGPSTGDAAAAPAQFAIVGGALHDDEASGKLAAAYPHMLLEGSLNDPRVPAYQPLMFAAKLRHSLGIDDRLLHRNGSCTTASDSSGTEAPIILCRIAENGGHFAGSGSWSSSMARRADDAAFLYEALNLDFEFED